MTAEETNAVDASAASNAIQTFLDLVDADVVDNMVRAFTVRELDANEQKQIARV